VREIAAVVGGREEAVKKRLSRTIRALKEQYDDEPC
jgi:DNA-directed RNA polymerase specialized sigma24 family protein